MLSEDRIRSLIQAMYTAGALAQDDDKAPLVDLDAEQYDALCSADGAAVALEVVVGDRAMADLELKILDTLHSIDPRPQDVFGSGANPADRIRAATRSLEASRRVFDRKAARLAQVHLEAGWSHLLLANRRIATVILAVSGFDRDPGDRSVNIAYLLSGSGDELDVAEAGVALAHFSEAWTYHEQTGFGSDLFTAEEDYDAFDGETRHYGIHVPGSPR